MCPNPFLYFDWKQTEAESEQGAFGVTTLETVYNYDPTPDVLTDEQKKLILGAQANVWTEWMPTEKDVEYMTIPRIYALAEIVWSQNEKDFEDFKRRLDMILKQELK
jgi:hexosaminidase